jgi:hypothetical protein
MLNNILKWTACAVTLTAALLTSFEVLGYNRLCFAVGAALYLLWAVRIREANLIVINGALLAIYAVGLIVK